MTRESFKPTDEQERVITHQGSAFVAACPGAGKTRVLVERARLLLNEKSTGKGIAFLSFTNAAISELQQRLTLEGLLPWPAFPHFIGTFDSFLWQFLVAPFGLPGCETPLRLIKDKGQRMIRPGNSDKLPELPLECFDRASGCLNNTMAIRHGFDTNRNARSTKAYETAAASARARFLSRGELDFEDARELAEGRIKDGEAALRLSAALAGRFRELIVDEAQDCNPSDLDVIKWLRDAGIPTKVICDPHQSIYQFRGGVTEELNALAQTFDEEDRLLMSGNFRSSDPICKAIVALRPRHARANPDRALGKFGSVTLPVHVFSYGGTTVPAAVGERFCELIAAEDIDPSLCPVLAATKASGAHAIGQPGGSESQDLTLRLAGAVTDFYFGFDAGNRQSALNDVHSVVLDIEGRKDGKTYHQFLSDEGLEPGSWRPRIIQIVRALRYDPALFPTPDAWLAHARTLFAKHIPPNGRTISQRLRNNRNLATSLAMVQKSMPPAKTIHAVKGMEFPAVCVVLTTKTSKGIIDYLVDGSSAEHAEEARKIYVAASRAQRLLAIATPRSQAGRLQRHLDATGAEVRVVDL